MADDGAPALTYGLRELVWGIESELAVIANLSRRIDDHVRAVNAARAELAERLVRLDALVDAAEDPDLERFLRSIVRVRLPEAPEELPERLYRG